MEIGPSYQMGLLHQTMLGIIRTPYQGDPLSVGDSSTVNRFLSFMLRRVLVVIVVTQFLFPSFDHFCRKKLLNLKCLVGALSLGEMCLGEEIWKIGLGM